MRWPWSRPIAPTNEYQPVANVLAGLFTPGAVIDLAGLPINESNALGLSAMFRAVSIISGQLAGLPMPTYTIDQNGDPKKDRSIFDSPDGSHGQTPFEWKETLVANALIHGRAYALVSKFAAGGVARLEALHPLCVVTREPTVAEYKKAASGEGELPVGGLWHEITLADATHVKLDARDVLYIPGLATDGKNAMGLIGLAKASLQTSLAADRAARKMFTEGALIAGLATPEGEEDITDDVPEILRQLRAATGGHENAGKIALLSKRLKFTPWTMTATDAQFMQSRQFQVEEIARWTGVPPHLLMQTEKQTSWGQGIEQQNRALGRTVLATWAIRFEQRFSRLLANPRYVKFDFGQLERPTPEVEQNMVINLVNSGMVTPNEGRKRLGLEPIEGGDILRNGQNMGAGAASE